MIIFVCGINRNCHFLCQIDAAIASCTNIHDFILEKYNEDPQQTIFITIHGMLFTILHGIFLDLPVERLNEVNQEIVRGCSLSLFEFDGKKHKIDFIGKDCFLTPLKEKISYK